MPPGYVGYEEGGQLTEKIRRRPYAVVLFDEIEKAHPDCFNLLLQILEDGRLTDGQGRIVNFKNTLVIMTSNIGSQYFLESPEDFSKVKAKVLNETKKHFKPEFLNRVDEIIVFNKLSEKEITKIVDLQLKDLTEKLMQKGFSLVVDSRAKEKLAHEGYSPEYGARPLRRLLQRDIQDPLALDLLRGAFKEGDKITVDVDKKTNAFVFANSRKESKHD